MPKRYKVLLLEDDGRIRKKMATWIETAFKDEVDVYPASDPGEADALLQENSGFDLLITDVMMPDGSPAGLDVTARVAPRMPVIIISAFKPDSFKSDVRSLGRVVFLEKTADVKLSQGKLLEEIRKCLDTTEIRNLCLQRHRGTILSVRFHLPHLPAKDIPHVDIREQDFLSIGFGIREWQKSVETHDGRVYAIYSQSMLSAFTEAACLENTMKTQLAPSLMPAQNSVVNIRLALRNVLSPQAVYLGRSCLEFLGFTLQDCLL